MFTTVEFQAKNQVSNKMRIRSSPQSYEISLFHPRFMNNITRFKDKKRPGNDGHGLANDGNPGS